MLLKCKALTGSTPASERPGICLGDQFSTMSESSQTKLVESSNNFMKGQFKTIIPKWGNGIY